MQSPVASHVAQSTDLVSNNNCKIDGTFQEPMICDDLKALDGDAADRIGCKPNKTFTPTGKKSEISIERTL